MERGNIVKVKGEELRGIVLNIDGFDANILHYDFSTGWFLIDDLEVIGHTDSIYKCMYEIMAVK